MIHILDNIKYLNIVELHIRVKFKILTCIATEPEKFIYGTQRGLTKAWLTINANAQHHIHDATQLSATGILCPYNTKGIIMFQSVVHSFSHSSSITILSWSDPGGSRANASNAALKESKLTYIELQFIRGHCAYTFTD